MFTLILFKRDQPHVPITKGYSSTAVFRIIKEEKKPELNTPIADIIASAARATLSTLLHVEKDIWSSLSAELRTFNYHICRARIVVENVFGRLKARWRRVSKHLDADIDNIPTIITACCILHNTCEVHGDAFVDNWLDEVRKNYQPHFHCMIQLLELCPHLMLDQLEMH